MIIGTSGANTIQGGAGADVIYGYDPAGATSSAITATRVATGFNQPVFAVAPPNDADHLYVVERGGLIKILTLSTGEVAATPFLDVSAETTTSGECGLLGLAFDPNYAQNGRFYVYVNTPSFDSEIRGYQASAADKNIADPTSKSLVISVDQPNFNNHKGGWIEFGPDGYLYVALGDGGSGNDPDNNAQNINSLLGKMLRLDVHADAFPGDSTRNYAIPSDNMFVGVAGADEIYAIGLRNPWRNSFDRATGDFYIADVGQGQWEEVNIGARGANYGWSVLEGPTQIKGEPLSGGTLTAPIHVYNHSTGHSITGGYVYRGSSDGLQGSYFFADFVDNRVWTLTPATGGGWTVQERTSQISYNAGTLNSPSSFAEDAAGNLYVIDLDGDIFRLSPQTAATDLGDTIAGGAGADHIYGGSGNDSISGDSGNDVLSGMNGNDLIIGGGGVNVLIGGAGDDIFYVNSFRDSVLEFANEGYDWIFAGDNYNMPANVEAMTLRDESGPLNAGGNTLDNYIEGNSFNNAIDGGLGNDTLVGGGGDDLLISHGPDTLLGGAGNDVYRIDSLATNVVENPSQGADWIFTTVSFNLPANVEGMVLDEAGCAINAGGNSGDNYILGNSFANALNGGAGGDTLVGGGGNDTLFGGGQDNLIGGTGDDVYVIDNLGANVSENSGEGNDWIFTSVSFNIKANVEGMVLQEAGGAINAGGNAQSNYIQGNSFGNGIDGGAGADTLVGFGGNDTFVFVRGQANGDVITDFDGAGAAVGDQLVFSGYGTSGASFTQLDAARWSINSSDGLVHDVITLANSAGVHTSDYLFV